jgi:formylglycine-generating enzyme required for sulfatase activity
MSGSDLCAARAQTDALFDLAHPDALYDRPIPERHRIIFYLGHLEAFDWNLVAERVLSERPVDATFDRLFAFGIDPDSSGLPQDRPQDWPGTAAVRAYNAQVRQKLDAALDRIPDSHLHVMVEHRLMHAETFAYMLHNLPFHRKSAGPLPATDGQETVRPEMVAIPGGRVALGAAPGDGFGWDNEFSRHETTVPEFAIGKHKVTNAEYLGFVRDGGARPHYWIPKGNEWMYRGMFGDVPLPLSAPVYVTHAQAAAYAAWRGKRLPTEAEYQLAAYPGTAEPLRDNFDFHAWDPIPVTVGEPNGRGAVQMVGNGWEWTSTPFQPFPGFQPFPFYPNYSEPFFDGQHYVMKGASPRTAARLTRASFRNWFRPSYPYVYATLRLAEGGNAQ